MALILPDWFQNLPQREQNGLLHDALKPLSGEEREIKGENLSAAQIQEELKKIATQVAEARARFVVDAIKALVQKGDVPQWVGKKGKEKAATEWLRRNGYHFQVYTDNPLLMHFYKGDQLLSTLEITNS